MNSLKKRIATSAIALWALASGAVWAGEAMGTVTQVSGPLLVKKANGSILALVLHSRVEQGDVLLSEKSTYARVTLVDDSELTLRPETQLKIEAFAFDKTSTRNADGVFSLHQGAVQISTPLSGYAGGDTLQVLAPNRLEPVASVALLRGVRTTVVVEYVAPAISALALLDTARLKSRYAPVLLAAADAPARADRPAYALSLPAGQDMLLATYFTAEYIGAGNSTNAVTPTPLPGSAPGLAPGLYVQVLDGVIHVTNPAGTSNFIAGQFGYIPSIVQAPVVVPINPGIRFTQAPAFNSFVAATGSTATKGAAMDCEVR